MEEKEMRTLENNINTLNQIVNNCAKLESRQLQTINKLRVMNGKQIVSSFEEHRILKLKGL